MADERRSTRPNILLVLADDMGFSDIGCYGSEVATPAIDGLAANGLRFSQMYNSARCCPSRASLLTGLHPHQTGIGHAFLPAVWWPFMLGEASGELPPAARSYLGYLTDNCVTVAELLQDAGYRTIMSGKWHTSRLAFLPGEDTGGRDRPRAHPNDRGFDEFYGILTGAGSYFNPLDLQHNRERLGPPNDPDYYLTDAITDHAIDHIGRALDDAQPFFHYLAFTAPHWPLHAFEEDVARYELRYRGGWDLARAERHERARDEGLLDERWPISTRDPDAWPFEEARFPEWEAHRMAVYAAQVDRMDRNVGRVVDLLRQRGALDDTLIFFLSDNGGCAEFLMEDGVLDLSPMAGTTPEGGPVRFGNDPGIVPGGADTFASYDLCWSNVSNAPFRRHKRWVHEGGIATPLIVHWPQRIRKPEIVHTPAHIVDIAPTCLEAAGVRYPTEFAGHDLDPLEGVSLSPTFADHRWERPGELYFEHEGNRALRVGDWKLVSAWPGSWELYDLSSDRTETRDLADAEPAHLKRLTAMWLDWARRVDVDLEFREALADFFSRDTTITAPGRQDLLRARRGTSG
ncbi:MAG TPA: arylsulfatase [Nitriliruptorales bacterium]